VKNGDTYQKGVAKMATIKTGKLGRSATFDRSAIDADARTVSLAFSTEAPYERWFGVEILDHSPESVDLSRMGNIPLLLDHNPEKLIGTIENISIGPDRVGRAVARFGRSALAEEAFRDMQDGIRPSISVGYIVNKMKEETPARDGKPAVMRVNDWQVLEISSVAIPADPYAGLGRSADMEIETSVEVLTREDDEPVAEETAAPVEDAPAAEETVAADEHVVTDERAVEVPDDLITVTDNAPESNSERTIMSQVDLTPAEQKDYSYARALSFALARAEGQNVSGFEVDVSQDIERNMPVNAKRNGGIFVPYSLQRAPLATSLYNTSGKGAETVFTEPGDFIELLRNQSVAVNLGARVLNGLQGPVSFPKQTGANTAYWVAENSGTDVTAGNATLGSVALSPKTLQATTAYSRQLLAQSSIDVEGFIRNDLAAVHALAWDQAVFHGAGASNEPDGLYHLSGVNAVAMGGVPTFGKIIDMITEVAKDNALAGNLAFVTTPGMAGKLAQTVVAASTDTRMIWGGSLSEGNLAGYRALASNQIKATLGGGSEHGLLFGNWNEILIGVWAGGFELVVDPYALKKQGMVEITSFQMTDVAARHAESFVKATGATIA
jgi:HK97 family phage major capsid protein